ncbi:MAG: iron-containing alcohol dehydrogenase [Bryobacteraceae bacterium]|jgi:alcohol dehydrogenase class IV
MHFEFATAARIVFGWGEARRLAAAAAQMGSRALLVTGSSLERARPLIANLESAGVACAPFSTPSEPTIDLIRAGAEYARAEGCGMVIAIGGGSAIDTGKALAALLTNPGEPLDYLEVIGRGQPLQHASAPLVAVPTTAGSGAEVTRNAVLASPAHRVKASLRSPFLLPRLALVDPELTLNLPRSITAATGLDALTQLIEPYVSSRANAMTDLYCVDGLRRAAAALPRVWEDGQDREARTAMSWVSLLGGLALANAGLGAVHAFAAPVGGVWKAPHGAICAAVLPHAIEVNVEALRRRAPANPALRRYDEIARLLTRQPHAIADDAVLWIANLCDRLEIPPLRAYGVTEADIPDLAEKAAHTSSMKGNPIQLTAEELREVALRAL